MAYNLRTIGNTRNPLLLFAVFMLFILLNPNKVSAQTETIGFTRSQGVFIRPELYGALLAEVGYQINPNFQISIGGGTELLGQQAFPELVFGTRAYASDSKWTAFFDYHFGLCLIEGYAIADHRFTIGPSFKNFDFGGGILYANFGGIGAWGFCLNIGYHFRIHST